MGIVFRSYYALPSLTRTDGTPIGALFGFCSMVIKLATQQRIGGLVAVFDSPGPTFRKKLYDQYKANRGDPPEDLVPQFDFVKRAMDAFSIPSVAQPGFEADDIIASIVAKRPNGTPVYIVSTDKDLMQLVGDHVYVYDAYKQVRYDSAAVVEKYGVRPDQMIDWLALVGDASDNIPGVAGVGPKTASKLLSAHHTIEGIREAIPAMKASKMKEKLAAATDTLDLSRSLVTLSLDCAVERTVFDNYSGWQLDKLIPFMEEFELRRLKRKVLTAEKVPEVASIDQHTSSSAVSKQDNKKAGTRKTEEPKAKTAHIGTADRSARPSIGLELPKVAPTLLSDSSAIAGWISSATWPVSFATVDAGSPIYCLADSASRIAIVVSSVAGWRELKREAGTPLKGATDFFPHILSQLAKVTDEIDSAGSRVPTLIVHDVKALLTQAAQFSELSALKLTVQDTMLAGYLLLSDRQVMNPTWLIEHFFQLTPDECTEAVQVLTRSLVETDSTSGGLPADKSIGENLAKDALAAVTKIAKVVFFTYCQLPLWVRLREDLECNTDLFDLYKQVELPLAQVLSGIERRGCLIDQSLLRELGSELARDIGLVSTEIRDAARQAKQSPAEGDNTVELNLNSPKQLATLLFDDIGLTPVKKTKTGYSTDSEVLEQLALIHPLPEKILRYRMLTKLKSTYVDQLQTLVSDDDGRVHGRFNQAVTATGRLSSSDPNLQNIPIRSDIGHRIRSAFIAPKGWQIIAADYSQIELRVLAHLSADAALTSAFKAGEDIHTRTALQIFGREANSDGSGGIAGQSSKSNGEGGHSAIDPREQRRVAKAVNFGVVYGQGDWGLAKQLGIPRTVAKQYIEEYFTHFSGVASYMQQLMIDAKETGQVSTLFGRQRSLPDITASNARKRDAAERIARNTPIQGTAADIIKLAMLSVSQWIALHGQGAIHMILSVHDELVFEVRSDVASAYASHIKSLMEQVCQLDVPLVVDIGIGANWDEAH